MPYDVFISHSKKDKAVAEAVCKTIEARKIRCWIAPGDIPPGTVWQGAIMRGLESCRLMILVFSSNAIFSPDVMREVQHAFRKDLIVVPFRIEDVAPNPDLEYYIGSLHWLDALTKPMEEHILELARLVHDSIGNSYSTDPPDAKESPVATEAPAWWRPQNLPSVAEPDPEQVTDPGALLEMLRADLRSGHPIIPLVMKVRGMGDSLAAPCFIIVEELGHNDLSALSALIRSWKKDSNQEERPIVLVCMKTSTGTAVDASQVEEISMVLRAADRDTLEDLAVATGGMCLSKDLGMKLENIHREDCGFAEQIQVLKSGVRIIEPTKQSVIKRRAKTLADLISRQPSDGAREMYRLRYEGLTGKHMAQLADYSPPAMPTDFDLQLRGEWASPYFLTSLDSHAADLTNPFVLVSSVPLQDLAARQEATAGQFKERIINGIIIPDTVSAIGREPSKGSLPISVLQKASSSSRGLLVIAPEFQIDALSTMVVNKLRGTVQVCAFKIKGFRRQDYEALAAKLKIAPFESSAAYASLDGFLGGCSRVICHEKTCFIKL